MANELIRFPAECFPPSSFVIEELEVRGWTLTYLSQRSGLPLSTLYELIAADKPVDREIAEGLAKAFGTGPEFWINLQTSWDKGRARTGTALR